MKTKQSAGMSLIELITAIAIFAMGSVAALAAVSFLTQAKNVTDNVTIATEDGQAIIERIKQAPFTQVTTMFPNGGAVSEDLNRNGTLDAGEDTNANGALDANAFNHLESERVVVTYANTAANPLQITVTVSWREGRQNATRSLPLTFLKTR